MEFRLLGPLEVVGEHGPLPLGGQKQRSLLAALLLNVGHVVSTDKLIDDLWGENPPRTAGTSLQNLVSHLRTLLGADAVETRPPGYVLHAKADEFDLARFQQLIRSVRGARAQERAEKLRNALALWRGPVLADLAYEPFVQSEAARLEEFRLAALEDRIDADLAVGAGSRACG